MNGKKIFALSNPDALCAAVAQTWLKKSLKHDTPATKPGSIADKTQMTALQQTAGKASETALPANGLQIVSQNISSGHTWEQNISWLFVDSGFLYLTMKNPNHAAACYIGASSWFFLDAEVGLFEFNSKAEFIKSVSEFYAGRTNSPGNAEFKIYKVDLMVKGKDKGKCTII